MRTKIQRWGNSLAIRIPKPYADDIGVEEDSPIEIALEDGELILTPQKKKFSLDELLESVTPENLHEEVSFGPARGKEAW